MYQIVDEIPVWGEPLPEAVEQIKMAAEGAYYAALMADHHLGYSVPIGGVVAWERKISPSAVGYDIACGNKAVRLDMDGWLVKEGIQDIMDTIFKRVPFGIGKSSDAAVPGWGELITHEAWGIPEIGALGELAYRQSGTVGAGNHYIDVFLDEEGRPWVGVHFGSRGLGHKIASHFIKAGGGKDGMHVKPVLFDVESELGKQYILAMDLAGKYAYMCRDFICSYVADLIGGPIVEAVHNNHNFAWRENHFDKELWVHRKGATPLFPGQKAFIGGSMGDISVIVEGQRVGNYENELSFCSTVHGAGRIMSRNAAKKTIERIKLEEMVGKRGIALRGADVDESPEVYKDLGTVLSYHENTRILHTLRPIGVAMAAADTRDPYKD